MKILREKGKEGNGESVWFGVREKNKIINNIIKLIIVSLILILTFPVQYQNHPDSLFPRFPISLLFSENIALL